MQILEHFNVKRWTQQLEIASRTAQVKNEFSLTEIRTHK